MRSCPGLESQSQEQRAGRRRPQTIAKCLACTVGPRRRRVWSPSREGAGVRSSPAASSAARRARAAAGPPALRPAEKVLPPAPRGGLPLLPSPAAGGGAQVEELQKEEKSLGQETWQRWETAVFCRDGNKLTIWKTSALPGTGFVYYSPN